MCTPAINLVITAFVPKLNTGDRCLFYVLSYKFDIVVIYYTDDTTLESGSEASGLFAYYGNILSNSGNVVIGNANNGTKSLILVVFILRFVL